MNENESNINFKPEKSNGGIWSFSILIVVLLIFIVPLAFLKPMDDLWFFSIVGISTILLGTIFGITVHGFYSMKYVVTEHSLTVNWSLISKTIPIQDIVVISSVTKKNLQGIRSFGVGIPGHLIGRFRLKFNGTFIPVRLYATELDNLVIIQSKDNVTFGITPEKKEEFIKLIQSKNRSVKNKHLDTAQPVNVSDSVIKRSRSINTLQFLVSVGLILGTFIYFIIAYQNLPETGVPLHWGLNGVVDRFGNRSELLTMIIIFSGVELGLSALVFIWMRKSDLGKIKIGRYIMLFPLIISLVISIINVIVMQSTINYF